MVSGRRLRHGHGWPWPELVATIWWLYILAKAVQGLTDNRMCISLDRTDNGTYPLACSPLWLICPFSLDDSPLVEYYIDIM